MTTTLCEKVSTSTHYTKCLQFKGTWTMKQYELILFWRLAKETPLIAEPSVWNPKLPKPLHMNGPSLPPSFTLLPSLLLLSGFPPFSLAKGQRPSNQSHTGLSVTGKLSLPPHPQQHSQGFLHCLGGHNRKERERKEKAKDGNFKVECGKKITKGRKN